MVEIITAQDVSNFMGLKPEVAREVTSDAASGQKDVVVGSSIVYFNVGDTVIIWDDDHPVGESRVIASLAGSTITLTENLTNTYEALKNAYIQSQSKFNSRSIPSITTVNGMIEDNEVVLAEDLHMSFLSDGQRYKERITVQFSDVSGSYPNLNSPIRYRFDTYRPIQFSYAPILPLDRSKDSLEIMIADERKDVLDPANGYVVWDDVVDSIVDDEDLSAASPITATLQNEDPMRLMRYLHYTITQNNITEFTLKIDGTGSDGSAISETFTEASGFEGYTTLPYATVTAVTFTRDAGSGATDTLNLDTDPEESRLSSKYDFWANYELGTVYPKSTPIELGKFSVYASYRLGMYSFLGGVIPGDIKKMVKLLTAIDLLGNERYAHNLPGGEGARSQENIGAQIDRWERQLKRLMMHRREMPGGTPYA